jgi:hypothetical protein
MAPTALFAALKPRFKKFIAPILRLSVSVPVRDQRVASARRARGSD